MAAALIGGGIAAAGAVGGGLLSSSGQQSAANTAASAQREAAALQMAQFQKTQQNLAPYLNYGTSLFPALTNQIGTNQQNYYGAYNNAQNAIPHAMTQAELVNTPGYQFQLAQGQQGVQSAAAARGLGVSGAALKGAANFATGLANSNYQTQFGNQQTIYGDYLNQLAAQQSIGGQLYNQIYSPLQLGESAAVMQGQIGQNAAGQAGTNIAGAGNSLAAGTAGAYNALGNAFASAPAAALGGYNAMNTLNALAYNQAAAQYPSGVYGPQNGNAPGSLAAGGTGFAPGYAA